MDLSSPLTALARRTDAAALSVLAAAGEPMTGRQVARLAGESTPSNIRIALLRLVDIGLVTSTARPDAVLYSANRSHLIWPAIESILSVRTRLIAQIKALAERHASSGTTVMLYGSVARGDADDESDVDLLVVSRPDVVNAEAFPEFLRIDVQKWTGNRAQVFEATPDDVRRMWRSRDPLIDSWLSDGILVSGLALENHLEAAP